MPLPTHCSHYRLAHAQIQLLVCQRRKASTTSYPYPNHPRPTPYQIFHLPYGASQKEIKERYYELVRAYHPDSAACREISSAERHQRFQAITAAYEALRLGRAHTTFTHNYVDPYQAELLRRKRAFNRRAEYQNPEPAPAWNPNVTPRALWKDWLIVLSGLLTLGAGLYYPALVWWPQHIDDRHLAAVAALRQAREDAQKYGTIRRRETRRRVSEQRMMDLFDEEEKVRGDQPSK